MKKSLLFLPILLASSLASCGGNNVDTSKVAIDYGYDYKNDIVAYDEIEIGYDTLLNKVKEQESFVLLIFEDRACSCWRNFNPNAIKFMNEYNLRFSCFAVSNLISQENTFGIYRGEDQMPGICFFRRGQLIRQTIYGLVKGDILDIFKKYDALEKYLLDNIYLPKMYYLDKDALDTKIDNDEEFNLYVARTGCGDCGKANREVLYSWSESLKDKAIPNKPLYIFDLKKYRGTEEYQTIKDTYGLSVIGNPTFGYDYGDDHGFVPTFQRWNDGEIVDMITILNDNLGENNTLSSYFTTERVSASPMLKEFGDKYVLNGNPVEEKDIGQRGEEKYVYRDSQAVWHFPILDLFLSTYVK